MQNPHTHDLAHGTIDKSGFEKSCYVRVDNSVRIAELRKEGYIMVHEYNGSDLQLMGLPKKAKDTKKAKE